MFKFAITYYKYYFNNITEFIKSVLKSYVNLSLKIKSICNIIML